jgi:hypothetical protein
LNRYGTATFLMHADKLYTFNFTAGVFCEMIANDFASGVTEFGTYLHLLHTFEFSR